MCLAMRSIDGVARAFRRWMGTAFCERRVVGALCRLQVYTVLRERVGLGGKGGQGV